MAAAQAQSVEFMTNLQAAAANPAAAVPELSRPNEAASIRANMARISDLSGIQQEAYLHLVRSFVLYILTPFQAGLLCAAAHPYLIEFPSVLRHVVAGAAAQEGPSGRALNVPRLPLPTLPERG